MLQQNVIKIFEMWHIRKTVTTEKNKTKDTMKNNLICKINKPHRNESKS